MAKYSLEFKLEVVKKFIAGESLPKLNGVQDKTILRYAQSRSKIYKEFDKNILDPKIIDIGKINLTKKGKITFTTFGNTL